MTTKSGTDGDLIRGRSRWSEPRKEGKETPLSLRRDDGGRRSTGVTQGIRRSLETDGEDETDTEQGKKTGMIKGTHVGSQDGDTKTNLTGEKGIPNKRGREEPVKETLVKLRRKESPCSRKVTPVKEETDLRIMSTRERERYHE